MPRGRRKIPSLADYTPLVEPAALKRAGCAVGGQRLLRPPSGEEAGTHDGSVGPLVSVITPTFNAARTLGKTLDSLARQSYAPIEHIVVDGGSTDGTLDLLRAAEDRIAFWMSGRDAGIYDAFNRGLAIARGAFVMILNADDWLEPETIANAVSALAGGDADFVHGDIWFHGYPGVKDGKLFQPGEAEYAKRIRLTMPRLHHGTILARAELYARQGLLRTDLRIASDYDWLLRISLAGCRGRYDSRVLVHRSFGGVSTRCQRRALWEGFRVCVGHGHPWLPAVLHWGNRFAFPAGTPPWAQGAKRGLRRVLPDAVTAPESPAAEAATLGRAEKLRAFVEVRHLGGSLPDLGIEWLIDNARRFASVACLCNEPLARQVAAALAAGGSAVEFRPGTNRASLTKRYDALIATDGQLSAPDLLHGEAAILLDLGQNSGRARGPNSRAIATRRFGPVAIVEAETARDGGEARSPVSDRCLSKA